jgi:predicted SprT family Zn-dependent metalloprotease
LKKVPPRKSHRLAKKERKLRDEKERIYSCTECEFSGFANELVDLTKPEAKKKVKRRALRCPKCEGVVILSRFRAGS